MKTEITATLESIALEMGFAIETGKPSPFVSPEWNAIAYQTTLTRNGKTVWQGDYKLGLGHVRAEDWNHVAKGGRFAWRFSDNAVAYAHVLSKKPHANLVDKAGHAAAAAEVAAARKIKPALADVLSSLLLDGAAQFDNLSFEEWAGDCGYDPDSRKAEAVFNACAETGRALARALSRDELDTLREAAANY